MKVLPIGLRIVKSFLIVGDNDELVLVDAGNPGDGDKIAASVREMGYRPEDVSLIVLTHGHRDHAGGIKRLKSLTGAEVLIHREDASVFQDGLEPPVKPRGAKGKFLGLFVSQNDRKADYAAGIESDCLLDDRLNLKAFGIEGEVIHTPGHTPGSLSVVLEDGTAIVGDLVMGEFLVVGRAALPFFATDPDELKASIDRVLSYGPKTIYPSHGGPYDPEAIRRLR